MNIDLLFTHRNEAGLVADERLSFIPTHAIYDFYSNYLLLSADTVEPFALNIALSTDNADLLIKNLGIHLGIVINGVIENVQYIPLVILNNSSQHIERFLPQARRSATAFELFMRECSSGQAIHRDDFSEETTSSAIISDFSPAVLQLAPSLAAQKNMELARNYTSEYIIAPSLGIGGTSVNVIQARQQNQVPIAPIAPANPMSFFAPENLEKKAQEAKTETVDKAKTILDHNVEKLLEPLNTMIGMVPLKEQIHHIVYMAQAKALRTIRDMPTAPVTLHMIFTGPPGTGKTSAAREIGRIMKELGYLATGHLVETSPNAMSHDQGRSAIEDALGGVLFIDEAYSFFEKEWHETSATIPVLLKMMEDHRDELIVICAGYANEMRKLLDSNPGFRSRFSIQVDFPNYTPDEMALIFKKFCLDHGYIPEQAALDKVKQRLSLLNTNDDLKSFGNGRGVRNIFEKSLFEQAHRIMTARLHDDHEMRLIKADDVMKTSKKLEIITQSEMDEMLLPLNKLVGMDNIKKYINDLVHVLHAHILRQKADLPLPPIVLHSLFLGPPGTGKTSVARILGKILKRLGFLEKGHVVEVDRRKLIGEYLGQTAPKTANAFHEAMGGILFIDEAYSLADENYNGGYGAEALSTLLKLMEDNRDKVIVICAGYEKEMDLFIKANSGLESRFPNHLTFKTYTVQEMAAMFKVICQENKYIPTDDAINKVTQYLNDLSEDTINNSGNGRLVRNIFEKTIITQSKRIATNLPSIDEVVIIMADDVTFPDQTKNSEKKMGFV